MDIPYLIQILQRKVIILNNAKAQAFAVGDLEGINTIDKELLGVQNTLAQLGLLSDVAQAAVNAGTTPADVVASGVDAVQNQTQGPSAGAVINGYDISAYATDPLYEQKIQSIVNAMPNLMQASDIDLYIDTVVTGSPVTGAMIITASTTYNVDMPLLVAIIQNDSSFGTQGVGARTNNPGNVGNTGSAEQMYPSWQDGVSAVAEWLNRHRVAAVTVPAPSVPAPQAPAVTPPTPSTPPASVPVVVAPVIVATSTDTGTSIPTVAATSSPDIAATTTPDSATSTPSIDTSTTTATTTP